VRVDPRHTITRCYAPKSTMLLCREGVINAAAVLHTRRQALADRTMSRGGGGVRPIADGSPASGRNHACRYKKGRS
jgi:hypothetical protein